jgi:hypothetical protein
MSNLMAYQVVKQFMVILKTRCNTSVFLLGIPMILTVFTHLWNPVGFPGVFVDEGYYMGRAMHVLEGLGPQEDPHLYDHPYFGQLFLAGASRIIGYPDSLHLPSSSGKTVNSIEMLYLVPRVLMGILAVLDTFLVYKIAELLYNRKIALIASLFFAVMPITWMLRWILLDTILLPFLLSSIFFAVHYYVKKDSPSNDNKSTKTKTIDIQIILLSGIFLGLAIFTKIPAFTMIPLVGFLIYAGSNNKTKSLKMIGLWIIPVIMIPLIWPAYSISVGQFNSWSDGVLRQTHRASQPLFDSLLIFFKIDPVLLLLGVAGSVFAAIKKDFLLLLWIGPTLIFLYVIGYVAPYHLVPLLPALSIAAAGMIVDLSQAIRRWKKNVVIWKVLPFAIISTIAIVGLVSTSILITTDLNSTYFHTVAFVAQYLEDSDNNKDAKFNNSNGITVIADPSYSWIPKYIFHLGNNYQTYYYSVPIKTQRVLLVVDQYFVQAMSNNNDLIPKQTQMIYNSNSTNTIATFGKNIHNHNQVSVDLYVPKTERKTK